jgi:hypothetical protein
MAKPFETMYFGQYKGQPVSAVPTDYLLWVFGSFPKLRKKLYGVFEQRGLSEAQVTTMSSEHHVLDSYPVPAQKRAWRKIRPKKRRRNEQQLKANEVARVMGQEVPYPKNPMPRAWKYFVNKEKQAAEIESEPMQSMPQPSS